MKHVASISELVAALAKPRPLTEFKCSCEAERTVTFHRFEDLPVILCICLKRFSFTNGATKKLSTKVSNPLADIIVQGISYCLKSVVIHSGSENSGHYVSIVFHQPDWWLCNDSSVKKLSSDRARALAENGYLFLYRKK